MNNIQQVKAWKTADGVFHESEEVAIVHMTKNRLKEMGIDLTNPTLFDTLAVAMRDYVLFLEKQPKPSPSRPPAVEDYAEISNAALASVRLKEE